MLDQPQSVAAARRRSAPLLDFQDHLAALEKWAAHMHDIVAKGLVTEPMKAMLDKWEDRNINRFGQPHQSGDDWQETIEAQLSYLRSAGFASITVPWQEDMWAIFAAVKSE